MPPPRDTLDPELLGRIAGSLEEQGLALRQLQVSVVANNVQTGENKTKIDSAHARLKNLEEAVNGNGKPGLKTDQALLQQQLASAQEDIKTLKTWREGLGDRKIQTLEQEKREEKRVRNATILTVIAIVISFASMVSNCGPQWNKAMDKNEATGSP